MTGFRSPKVFCILSFCPMTISNWFAITLRLDNAISVTVLKHLLFLVAVVIILNIAVVIILNIWAYICLTGLRWGGGGP